MTRLYDLVTFDCYGTLIDWEGGISTAFTRAAAEDGVQLEREAVLRAHAKIEPAVQGEAYRTYRSVLGETAQRMAKRFEWALAEERAGFLADSLPSWPPFDDVNPALERLASAGIRLGILSNVDDDLLAQTLRHFTVTFDLLITAERVGSYKPAPGHFEEARRRIEHEDPSGGTRWLHAAQSYFHDVVPAWSLGIPVAWINRKREEPSLDARPTKEFDTLTGLAEWLT
jgi:2-haloalkanoic acid dehalogenase type II